MKRISIDYFDLPAAHMMSSREWDMEIYNAFLKAIKKDPPGDSEGVSFFLIEHGMRVRMGERFATICSAALSQFRQCQREKTSKAGARAIADNLICQ